MTSVPRTRLWHAHIALVVIVEFSMESARGLVLPTLFSYAQSLGGDLAFVGLLTALFSAGRLASSVLLGWLCDRTSFKTVYVASAGIAMVGNLLYVLPYSPRIQSKVLLGASRFLVGVGAGNRSVCRAHVAALTRVEQRLAYFTILATVVFLAYALTPGLGGIVGEDVDVRIGGSDFVHFNRLTAPGFLLASLNALSLFLIAVVYNDSVSRADAPKARSSRTLETIPFKGENRPTSSHRVAVSTLLLFFFLNFNARGMLSVFETINVPLYLKVFNSTSVSRATVFEPDLRQLSNLTSSDVVTGASHFYLMIGLIGLLSYGAVHMWGGQQHRVYDTTFLLLGFTMLFAGNGMLVVLSQLFSAPHPKTSLQIQLFVVAEILVWSIGSPIASAVIVPAFSKAIGSRPQGTLMGLFGASASIARMSMPLLPSLLPSWELLFVLNMGLCASSLFALAAFAVAARRSNVPASLRDSSFKTSGKAS